MSILFLHSKKTKFTRMCIAEAIIALLESTDLAHLKISAIVHKAGVSRMTFYKYYFSPRDALEDYLRIIVDEFLDTAGYSSRILPCTGYGHVLFALNFFDRYRCFFLTMEKQGLYQLLLDTVNGFITEHTKPSDALTRFKGYAYAAGLLNCYLLWEKSGKSDSAETVARCICKTYGINE